jgi:hypothetical protein
MTKDRALTIWVDLTWCAFPLLVIASYTFGWSQAVQLGLTAIAGGALVATRLALRSRGS